MELSTSNFGLSYRFHYYNVCRILYKIDFLKTFLGLGILKKKWNTIQ